MIIRMPRLLFAQREAASGVVLCCLLLAGVAEVAGVGSLLPALAAVSGGGGDRETGLGRMVHAVMDTAGLPSSLVSMILLAVGFMAVKSLLSFAALSYAGVLAARVSITLRRRLVAAFFDARWSFLTEQKTGHLANALGNDAARAGDAYLVSAQAAAYAIEVAAYVALNLLVNWRVAVFGLAGGILVILALGRLVEMGRRAGYRQTDATAELATLTADAMAGLKPIKSMWRHHAIQARIARALSGVYRSLVAREVSKAGLTEGSDLLLAVLVGGGLYLGHVVGGLALPELIISGIGFFQILSITSRLQRYLQQAVQLESAFIRTTAMIEQAEANREFNRGLLPPPHMADCRFEQLCFRRGGVSILQDLDLLVPAGQITVLQGHSGAGKTTIIDLLLGLYTPDGGRILLGDVPLAEVDLWAWRRQVGYVPQELNLFHASIRDNVALLDPHVSDEEVWEALALAGAAGFVRDMPEGLDTGVGERGAKLSGGERQRISLARALLGRPQILILDEVTSALDPVTEAQVIANIVALKGRFTVLTISHRPAWASVADRIYDLRGGRAALADAPPSRRLAQPLPVVLSNA